MLQESRAHASRHLDMSELSCLPAALAQLLVHLQRQVEQDEGERDVLPLQELIEELTPLKSCPPTDRCFEAAVTACVAAGYQHHEAYLTFLYNSTAARLVEYAISMLKYRLPSADSAGIALDLVSHLFTQMAEAVLDGAEDLAQRLPPAGHAMRWLYCAVRNDINDHCKSGECRLEQHIQTLEHETYERAVDRTVVSSPAHRPEVQALLPLEQVERRDAFLRAFDRATQHLKPRHQQALAMRELEHQSPRDIAERMHVSEQQALDLLQYGREKRAELVLMQLRHDPALSDMEQEREELLALLKRVKLLSLAQSLRSLGRERAGGGSMYPRGGPVSDVSPPDIRGSWNAQ